MKTGGKQKLNPLNSSSQTATIPQKRKTEQRNQKFSILEPMLQLFKPGACGKTHFMETSPRTCFKKPNFISISSVKAALELTDMEFPALETLRTSVQAAGIPAEHAQSQKPSLLTQGNPNPMYQ